MTGGGSIKVGSSLFNFIPSPHCIFETVGSLVSFNVARESKGIRSAVGPAFVVQAEDRGDGSGFLRQVLLDVVIALPDPGHFVHFGNEGCPSFGAVGCGSPCLFRHERSEWRGGECVHTDTSEASGRECVCWISQERVKRQKEDNLFQHTCHWSIAY